MGIGFTSHCVLVSLGVLGHQLCHRPRDQFSTGHCPFRLHVKPRARGNEPAVPPCSIWGPKQQRLPSPRRLLSASSASAGLWSLSTLRAPSSLRPPSSLRAPSSMGPGPRCARCHGSSLLPARATERVSVWTPGPALVARPRAPPSSSSKGPGSSTGGSGGSALCADDRP